MTIKEFGLWYEALSKVELQADKKTLSYARKGDRVKAEDSLDDFENLTTWSCDLLDSFGKILIATLPRKRIER